MATGDHVYVRRVTMRSNRTRRSVPTGRLLLAALVLGVAGATATMPAGAVEPDGVRTGQVMQAKAAPALMLNYTFARETGTLVRDRSASGLNGELVDTTAPAAYVPGLAGHNQALKLIGAQHQYVDVGDAPELDVNRYSLTAWVNYTGVANDLTLGRWEVMEKAGAYWLNIRTDGRVRVGGFYGGCTNSNWKYLDSPNPIPINTWTHLASTYNGSQLAIWVNGVKVATRAVTGATCVNAEPLAVGAKNAPAKEILEAFYDGRLDDVRVYNRAISASQIATLAAR